MVAAYYKKDDLLHCWTSSRIFPATERTFTNDTALSDQGMGAAWERHAMCESALTLHASLEVGHVILYVACMNRERRQPEKQTVT